MFGGPQLVEQLPALHCVPAGQTLPHPPQLALSVWKFAQYVLPRLGAASPLLASEAESAAASLAPASLCGATQRLNPAWHESWHLPAVHCSPLWQTVPQPPQLT